MKKFLVTIAVLGFGFSAQADHHYEVQISSAVGGVLGDIGSAGGTSGGIQFNDDEFGDDDNNPWSLGAEVYKSMTENIQVGGLLNFGDSDTDFAEFHYTVGLMGRYNLDTELRDSMYFGLGVIFSDFGIEDSESNSDPDTTRFAILASVGKRYALSDTITYTPNITVEFGVGGDFDEGTRVSVNLLSFSGFM